MTTYTTDPGVYDKLKTMSLSVLPAFRIRENVLDEVAEQCPQFVIPRSAFAIDLDLAGERLDLVKPGNYNIPEIVQLFTQGLMELWRQGWIPHPASLMPAWVWFDRATSRLQLTRLSAMVRVPDIAEEHLLCGSWRAIALAYACAAPRGATVLDKSRIVDEWCVYIKNTLRARFVTLFADVALYRRLDDALLDAIINNKTDMFAEHMTQLLALSPEERKQHVQNYVASREFVRDLAAPIMVFVRLQLPERPTEDPKDLISKALLA